MTSLFPFQKNISTKVKQEELIKKIIDNINRLEYKYDTLEFLVVSHKDSYNPFYSKPKMRGLSDEFISGEE